MKTVLFLAALLAASPAVGQVVTSPTKIQDSNDDGVIFLQAMASKVTPAVKKGTAVLDCNSTAAPYRYAVRGKATCDVVVTPTPPVIVTPTPTPTDTRALVGSELFLTNAYYTLGLNSGGGIGTIYAAPVSFRTDTGTGLKRAGLYAHGFGRTVDDLVLQGRAISGFFLKTSAVSYVNLPLTTYGKGDTPLAGSWTKDAWTGSTSLMTVKIVPTLNGKRVQLAYTITSPTDVTASFGAIIDPDQSSDNAGGEKNFGTTQRVPDAATPGIANITLYGGRGDVRFGIEDADAAIYTNTYTLAHQAGVRRLPGSAARTGDETVQAIKVLNLKAGVPQTVNVIVEVL